MTQAMHTALDTLTGALDRSHDAINTAIDAVVTSHQHGGKDAFDERVRDLRSTVANLVTTAGSLSQVTLHLARSAACCRCRGGTGAVRRCADREHHEWRADRCDRRAWDCGCRASGDADKRAGEGWGMTEPKRRGRPPINNGSRKGSNLKFRLRDTLRNRIGVEAAAQQLSMSEYVERALEQHFLVADLRQIVRKEIAAASAQSQIIISHGAADKPEERHAVIGTEGRIVLKQRDWLRV